MKDREALTQVLKEAEELAAVVSEPYRVAAYGVVATWLLDGQSRSQRGPVDESARLNTSGGADEGVPESVNELLALLHRKSHQDRFEAIIYHALRRQAFDGLSTDQILSAYSAGRVARPANPADVIAKCHRRGHVMEGEMRDGQKTWRLTTGKGERYIEQLLHELADA